jgi:hypothetical protein
VNHTLLLVQVEQGLGDLNDDVAAQIFAKVGQADDLMEKFTPWAQLKDDKVVLSRLGERHELDNVWVI